MWTILLLSCASAPPAPTVPAVVVGEPSCDTPAACRSACDADDALACNRLALFAHDGRAGQAWDRALAARSYRKACDLGAGIGCYNLSEQLRSGDGVPEDPAEADRLLERTHRLYEQSCTAGGLTWCTNLAGLVQRGDGRPPDQERARTLYADTCDRGDDLACLELAAMMIDGHGGPHDPEGGDALLRKRCAGGSGPACNNLALRMEDAGADATDLFRKACAAGVATSCRNLALRLPEGSPERQALLEQSCEAPVSFDPIGCAVASQALLGTDPAKAGSYLVRACSVGLGAACLPAVELAADGRFALDPVEARGLVERGCRLGDPDACAALEPGPPGE